MNQAATLAVPTAALAKMMKDGDKYRFGHTTIDVLQELENGKSVIAIEGATSEDVFACGYHVGMLSKSLQEAV